MGAEDFSFYLTHAPGAMLRLGTGCAYKLHHPQYDFGDAPLETGIGLFVAITQRFLS
jgi:amidohydrolase